MWTKRLAEVTAEDVRRLIDEQTPEDEELEFKETLPAKNGVDPWITGAPSISDRARNELIEEVIAFANGYGGVLILGIGESQGKPPRADKANPLPRCAELAERLRLQCRDCIEPQIPMLEVRCVPTDSETNGFVLFKVPRSRLAPHRHTITRECYARRADRSEKMSMREIRDLTIQVEGGLRTIEHVFERRTKDFSREFTQFRGEGPAYAIRTTGIPLIPIEVSRVHKAQNARQPPSRLFATLDANQRFEIQVPINGISWRPVMRGTKGSGGTDGFVFSEEILDQGLIECRLFVAEEYGEPPRLFPSWFMAVVANSLMAIERFRRAAGAPDAEYGFDIALLNRVPNLPIQAYGSSPRSLGHLVPGEVVFPRYSVGPREELAELCELIERDFWNGVGHDWKEKFRIDLHEGLEDIDKTLSTNRA